MTVPVAGGHETHTNAPEPQLPAVSGLEVVLVQVPGHPVATVPQDVSTGGTAKRTHLLPQTKAPEAGTESKATVMGERTKQRFKCISILMVHSSRLAT